MRKAIPKAYSAVLRDFSRVMTLRDSTTSGTTSCSRPEYSPVRGGKRRKRRAGEKRFVRGNAIKKKKKKNDDGGQVTPPPPPRTFGVFPDDDNVEPLEPGGHPGGVEAVDEVDVEVESFWCVL